MTNDEILEIIQNSGIEESNELANIAENSQESASTQAYPSHVETTTDNRDSILEDLPSAGTDFDLDSNTISNTPEETTQEDPIPENSKSLEVSETTARFSSAIWYEKIQEKTILLAGIGGIGSYVAFLLGRMKPKALYLIDDDIVEAVNMSGQLYSIEDVGINKTTSISNMISKYAAYNDVFCINERFTRSTEANDIMICGFDNMKARKDFFNSWKEHVNSLSEDKRENCLFIDGRLAAEEFQVLCIRGDDDYNINLYENKYLFSDSEADATVCSYKQTTYMANMIGSIIVNLFTNFVANQCNPLIERDLPFFTSYNAETMYFKTRA